jgi:hypothetical protein
MFSTLRNRFGIPGVISVIALVFAMFGGAYAASNSSGGPKATASAKAKKGPKGPKGATGPAGPAGPQGPAGANGKDGSNGSNGTPGTAGTPGKSVVTASFEGTGEPAGEPCEENGGNSIKVEGSAETRYACNGAEGAQGNPGSPWTAGGTLPVGSTETGAWDIPPTTTGEVGQVFGEATMSFPIQLTQALDASHVHYINPAELEVSLNEEGELVEEPSTQCLGNATSPSATSGNFCLYAARMTAGAFAVSGAIHNPAQEVAGAAGTGKAGAWFRVTKFGSAILDAHGTWAVTG